MVQQLHADGYPVVAGPNPLRSLSGDAADVPPERAAVDAAAQRPLNTTALIEGSGEPAWKTVPSWFVYPELDYNIPLAAHRFMAERADARANVELPGASHAIPASEPTAVAEIILKAATSTGWEG
ncbi:alpha/beta fold hydrolase [Micromonospora sp. NPDC050276]|uniref:alpha/beta fold hydrolase n=1 Tax=Micromonospora sp. NPDC050276 TaxID=3364278 RepID=UPI0037944F69